MAKGVKKRKKQLSWAIGITGLTVVGILGWLYYAHSYKDTYIPGEEIEGLTSDLDRDLPTGYPKASFTDVTEGAGIDFHHFGAKRTTQLPEDMGSGVAWGDFNNNGWEDVFIADFSGNLQDTASSISGSQLYLNQKNGTFKEVSASVGLQVKDYVNGCAWVDYDNDGWLDLFLTCYGRLYLFQNVKGAQFVDVTSKSKLDRFKEYWTGIAVGDYNKDGQPDIYVCGYVHYEKSSDLGVSLQYNAEVPASINPSSFPPIGNLLLRNNGNGTFTDVAAKLGVQNASGRSLEAVWCDFDDDGNADLYVANDVSDNALYRNNGKGGFDDISYNSFVADYRGAMGIATADWDIDGDFDMFITHWMAQENAFYVNMMSQMSMEGISPQNRIKFMDQADKYGLGQIALTNIGFATFFFDYDNDGRQDLYIANGSTFQEREQPGLLTPMKDQLLWNYDSEKGFYDVSVVGGDYFKEAYVGRAGAFADYDNDGDLDVILNNNNGPAKLLRNDGGNDKNWLEVSLHQSSANTFALGAKITIVTKAARQVRQVASQGPYLSQNMLRQHFGIGQETLIDSLIVKWPDGKQIVQTNITPNQILVIENGKN